MAQKTIPELDLITAVDGNSLFPVDSGTQTFKATGQKVADGLVPLMGRNKMIFVWDSASTYASGDAVLYAGKIYVSLKASNLNKNPATVFSYWKEYRVGGLNPQISQTLATRALATWAAKTAAAGVSMLGLCWARELGLYIGVGNSDTNGVAVSADGSTWTGHNAPSSKTWNDVCYAPELKLAIAVASGGGDANKAMTSPDGSTWSGHAIDEDNSMVSVCWANWLGLAVAVSVDGTHRAQTSPDGSTWTKRTAATGAWRKVIAIEDLQLLVAVGDAGVVMTSTDGITWAAQTGAEANDWKGLCHSKDQGLIVAVASSGTHRVQWSRDGVNWNAATAAEANAWQNVCVAPELGVFIAVSQGGTNRVMISFDAITWTPEAASSAKTWFSIAWSPTLGIVAAGSADAGSTGMMISKYVKKFIAA